MNISLLSSKMLLNRTHTWTQTQTLEPIQQKPTSLLSLNPNQKYWPPLDTLNQSHVRPIISHLHLKLFTYIHITILISCSSKSGGTICKLSGLPPQVPPRNVVCIYSWKLWVAMRMKTWLTLCQDPASHKGSTLRISPGWMPSGGMSEPPRGYLFIVRHFVFYFDIKT